MDATTPPPPTSPAPPAPPPPQRRLLRSVRDRKVAGVAGGLGAYTGVDPVVFRLAFVALALAGGVGILLYLIAWIVVPEGETGPAAVTGGDARTWVAVAVLAVAAVVLLGEVGDVGGLWFAAVLIGIGVLLFRDPAPQPTTAPLPPPPPRYAAGGGAGPAPQPPAPPTAPPSVLGRLTLAAALVSLGGAALLDRVGLVALTPLTGMALLLVVVGGGLVVGAFAGRARGLIAVGLALVLALLSANALQAVDVPLAAGVGERNERPQSVAAVDDPYRLLAGEIRLDLTGVEVSGEPLTVRATVGAGQITVTVPRDVTVEVTARAAVGSLDLLGREVSGTAVRLEHRDRGVEGAGVVRLDLRVAAGEIIVVRDSATSLRPLVPSPTGARS